jgi:ankyrin repeat protein
MILAQACLGVLFRLDDGVDRDSIKNFPLVEYAAEYWVTHAQFKNVSSRISDGMECLFDANKPHFAAWVWVYDHERVHSSMNKLRPEKPEADPLYYAARLGFRGLAEHLLAERPTSVDPEGGAYETPLHVALALGHVGVSWLLIEHGANVEFLSKNGWTPIFSASRGGLAEIVRWLLEHGGNVNVRNNNSRTPLHTAAFHGHLETVRALLEHQADINGRDYVDETPLYDASSNGHETVRLLLAHGAKVDLCNKAGRTAIEMASGPQKQEIVHLLSEYVATLVE